MANFGAFEIETPQEVLRRLQEQNAPNVQAALSGNTNQAFYGITSALANALTGSREVQKSRQTQQAATRAFSDLEKRDGEDDIDFRKRQVETFFNQVKDTDPALAAQASMYLTQLQNERLERNQLLAGERRRESNESRLQQQYEQQQIEANRRNLFGNVAYVLDQEGNAQGFDISTPEGVEAIEAARQEGDKRILTRDEMVALDKAQAKSEYKNLFNKSDLTKREGQIKATTGVARIGNRILQILSDQPDSLTGTAKFKGFINNTLQEVGAVQRTFDMDAGVYDQQKDKIRDHIAPEARARGVTESMILDLAYTLAKMRDPNGRLSDQDINLAIRMVGGEASDPSIFARNLLERTKLEGDAIGESLSTYNQVSGFEGSGEGKILNNAHSALQSEWSLLQNTAKRFLPESEYNSIMLGIPEKALPVQSTTSPDSSQGDAPLTIQIIGID